MERYTNTLMGNSQQSIKVVSVFKWMIILDYDIKEDVYGLTGWIRFATERNPKDVNEISSIHLDQHHRFKKLFRWS